MGTGLSSLRASIIHTSLGQSAPLSGTHSSLTTHRLRSKSGSTVCVKPLKGGDGFHCDSTRMSLLFEMSSTNAPPSMQPTWARLGRSRKTLVLWARKSMSNGAFSRCGGGAASPSRLLGYHQRPSSTGLDGLSTSMMR
jgi:hypothetical protein